ncbi:hypothetical protein pdam_00012755 [Pocillopora damicornis]|uniref:DZIP3-like HEPN domain-containing protein n=1 Tax=Pocillopora damicornis TaxID=46731 RepID=A0A3M6TTF8_POCDA|nr:hypothetical protein pdam_00012755 [Pocillopora damicornis]
MKFLHSMHPESTLQNALNNNRPKLDGLRRKRVIFDEQWEKLFPSSGKPPDSKEFDITLLHLLLREVCHLSAPSTGWRKMPADTDASPEASIVRIKCYRNELCHSVSTGVPNDEFEDKWNKISSSLEVLEVAAHRKKLQSLKSATTDHEAQLVEEALEQWRREKELEKIGKIMAGTASSPVSPVSSGSSVLNVSEEKTNGTKLMRLLVDGGTHVLRNLLHSVYPTDKLQVVLNNNKAKLQLLRSRGVIFKNQWEMLFPAVGDPPDSKTFDISLLHLLLREICHLTAPSTGWHNMPAEDDNSLGANITRIKCFRNELCHNVSTEIPNAKFEDK